MGCSDKDLDENLVIWPKVVPGESIQTLLLLLSKSHLFNSSRDLLYIFLTLIHSALIH